MRFTILLAYFSFCILHSAFCITSDPAFDFQKANQLYQKQNYDSASKVYEQLISSGNISAEVYYNLGNCYYKTNNVAKSIINYERAVKLKPDDEDILTNLHIAQLKVVDKIERAPQIFYKRWISNIVVTMPVKTWSQLVLVLVWITFLFAAIYILSSSPARKQLFFIISAFFLLLTLAAWFFSNESYILNITDKNAIVTSASVYVKSSPDEKGNDLFIIHEGTKVDVLDDFADWKKIRIANGSVGWIKGNTFEEI